MHCGVVACDPKPDSLLARVHDAQGHRARRYRDLHQSRALTLRYPRAMRIGRVFRRWWSGTLVLAVLFTQLATAAYACPAGRSDATTTVAVPCAEMVAVSMALDAEQPALCMQHCQFGNTQLPPDAGLGLQAPAVALTMRFVVAPALPAGACGPPLLQRERVHDRTPPLALSIANCCWRI